MLTKLFLNYNSDAKVYEILIRKSSDCTSIVKCEGISLQEVINKALTRLKDIVQWNVNESVHMKRK